MIRCVTARRMRRATPPFTPKSPPAALIAPKSSKNRAGARNFNNPKIVLASSSELCILPPMTDKGLSQVFSEARALPTAKYFTPESARVDPDKTMVVGMSQTIISDSKSQYPVIGTNGFNPCLCLILYNKTGKAAIVRHEPLPDAALVRESVAQIRTDENDKIEAHLIGAAICDEEFFDMPDPPDHILQMMMKSNASTIGNLEDVLHEIGKTPNITLKTFDVYDKPKPCSVAIDTRNGRLITGTDLIVSLGDAETLSGDKFDAWNEYEEGTVFDGRSP